MATVAEKITEIVAVCQRDLNCLTDPNRGTRKRGTDKIRKLVEEVDAEVRAHPDFVAALRRPLVALFADPTERCRENAVLLMKDLSDTCTDLEATLPLVIPAISQRLGAPTIVEDSEEVRLVMVTYLTALVELPGSKEYISMYVDNYVATLTRTLVDPYQEIRKQSCRCMTALCKAHAAKLELQATNLLAPVLTNLSHAHSAVRVIGLDSMADLIMVAGSSTFDVVLPVLLKVVHDSIPKVRIALINAIIRVSTQ
jgi:dynein assembly factor 5